MLKTKFFLPIFIFLLGTISLHAQFDIPETPKNQTSVYDYVDLLPLDKKKQFRTRTGTLF